MRSLQARLLLISKFRTTSRVHSRASGPEGEGAAGRGVVGARLGIPSRGDVSSVVVLGGSK